MTNSENACEDLIIDAYCAVGLPTLLCLLLSDVFGQFPIVQKPSPLPIGSAIYEEVSRAYVPMNDPCVQVRLSMC